MFPKKNEHQGYINTKYIFIVFVSYRKNIEWNDNNLKIKEKVRKYILLCQPQSRAKTRENFNKLFFVTEKGNVSEKKNPVQFVRGKGAIRGT